MAETVARLTSPSGPPVIVIIDDIDLVRIYAIAKRDASLQVCNMNNAVGWLTPAMPSHVKVVISFARDSRIPKEFKNLERPMNWIRLGHLDKSDVKVV